MANYDNWVTGGAALSKKKNIINTPAPPASIAKRPAPAPTPAARDNFTVTPAPTPTPDPGSGGGPVDSSFVPTAPAAPKYSEPAQADLEKSVGYLARNKALTDALGLFNAQQNTDSTRYNLDYGDSLKKLGYMSAPGAADPGAAGGSWDEGRAYNEQGLSTVSGRAFTNQLNDFAARGLSQSGMFMAANANLRNQLNDQRGSIEKNRTQFSEDQISKLGGFKAEQDVARSNALKEAKDEALNAYLRQANGL